MLTGKIALLGLCLSLLAAGARAEPPSGSYVITVDGDSVVRLFQGAAGDEWSPDCYGAPLASGEPICTHTFSYTNAAAQVTAGYSEQFGGDMYDTVQFSFWGDMRRKSKAMGAKLNVAIAGARTTDATTWLAGGGKVACRDDLTEAWLFTCSGKLDLCSSLVQDVEGACEKRPYTFTFPELRAPWHLELDLETGAAGRVSGTARAVLPTENTQVLYLDAVGKYSSKTDTVKLKIGGDYGGRVKMGLTNAKFAGDQVIAGRLKYKLTGQSGKFEIHAPE